MRTIEAFQLVMTFIMIVFLSAPKKQYLSVRFTQSVYYHL